MQYPSFVFHSYDIGLQFYKMWSTVDGTPRYDVTRLVSKIYGANLAAKVSLNKSIQNVILNVHGSPGLLRIGGMKYEATLVSDLTPFSILKGVGIGTIWLVTCRVARGSEGKLFCKELARLSGSIVVASEYDQIVSFSEAVALVGKIGGVIDSYEGKEVIAFHPNGTMKSSRDLYQLVNTLRPPPTIQEMKMMQQYQRRWD